MQFQESLLEGLLDLPHAIATAAGVLAGVGGVHNVEQRILRLGGEGVPLQLLFTFF